MPQMFMEHAVDPKEELLASLGDISDIEIFNNQVLLAIYIRPEKTKSGIILTDKYRDEDKFQSKAALVIKKGPIAFDDPSGNWFKGMEIDLHDWVIYRPSDGWSINVNGVNCRVIDDNNIRGRVSNPDCVW